MKHPASANRFAPSSRKQLGKMNSQWSHDLNLVFLGNIPYPHGMAETKRVQHAIDSMKERNDVHAQVLLLRQRRDVSRDDHDPSGAYKGTPYQTIGMGIELNWKLPFSIGKYIYDGMVYLHCHRKQGWKNVVYLYKDPNIENALFLLYASLVGYKVVCDITEDCNYVVDSPHLLSKVKLKTSQIMTNHIRLFADAVIVNSSHLRRKFEKISKGRFKILLRPISVKFEDFSSSREEFHSPIRILYSGSFGEKDGVELLIDAFEEVSRAHEDVRLILTGKGVENRMSTITKIIRAKPLEARSKIELKGYLPDLEYYSLLNDCDILCMTRVGSKFANAGFPFKLGEYLATGKPVLATAVSDVNDFVQDKISAVLVEPDSIASITKGLKFLITHSREAFRIGSVGREVARKHFDYRLQGEQLWMFLNNI